MPILQWLDRAKHTKTAERVPYRLLEADDTHSAGDPETPNMLIQGDNLEALKSLLPYYAGRVKCIFIDPPYNTRSAFGHYDDNLEHSQWLAMMFPRLQLLRDLLAEDGSIWVTIDDNEAHYLKVIMDEIFGRRNFIVDIAWHKRISPANDAQYFSADYDHIFVFSKNRDSWKPNRLPKNTEQLENYRNPDNDPRGAWNSAAYTCAKSADERPNLYYAITNPYTKQQIFPSRTRVWAYGEPQHFENEKLGLVYWGKDGSARMPRIKKLLDGSKNVVPRSIWSHQEAGHNQEARLENMALFTEALFDTPKPERLIQRILQASTSESDLVLDSFLGSGTTAAAAHKMGRHYIGIELGDHALTHCVQRMKRVVEGEHGGISAAMNWQGGGGFRFYKLGAPVFDTEGHINPQIRFAHLAAHIWFSETHGALHKKADSALLGTHNGAAYYLLYNGILGDKRPDGGNVLTAKTLAALPPHEGQKVIYGEASRVGAARLKDLGIIFKQTPYDVKAS